MDWIIKKSGWVLSYSIVLGMALGTASAMYSIAADRFYYYRAYKEPSSLVRVGLITPTSPLPSFVFMPHFHAFKSSVTTLSEIAGVRARTRSVTVAGEVSSVFVAEVTHNYFTMLGVVPVDEQRSRATEPSRLSDGEAILAYPYWVSAFGARSLSANDEVILDGRILRVKGVLPRNFNPPLGGVAGQIYVKINDTQGDLKYDLMESVSVIGRLRAGAKVDQVKAELDTIVPDAIPQSLENRKVHVTALKIPPDVPQMRRYLAMQSAISIVAAVVVGLGILNAAGILILQNVRRRKEFAIKYALGARPSQILLPVAREQLALALSALAFGFLFANWVLPIFLRFGGRATWEVPPLQGYAIMGLFVVAFLVMIMMATYSYLKRINAWGEIKETNSLGGGISVQRWRTALVTAEIAFAMLTVSVAVTLHGKVRSLDALDLGFDSNDLTVVRINPTWLMKLSPGEREPKAAELQRQLAALPGVLSVSSSTGGLGLEFGGSRFTTGDQSGSSLQARRVAVRTKYFGAMGVRSLTGSVERMFEVRGATCVVSASFAKRLFGTTDVLGRTVMGQGAERYEIVSVVSDIRTRKAEPQPTIYIADESLAQWSTFYWIRGAGQAVQESSIRGKLHEVDPRITVQEIRSASDWLKIETQSDYRILGLLMVAALFIALVTAVGLSVIVGYSFEMRRSELSLRIALGATNHAITRLIARDVLTLTLVGIAFGASLAVVIAAPLAKFVQTFGQPQPLDLAISGLIVVLSTLPSIFRATVSAKRLNPIDALKVG